jgi:cytochrome c oxidase assembly protein subunit 11
MPVFFFIDKEILKDPAMDHVNHITLSYTFFKTGEDGDEETPILENKILV